MPRVEEWLRDIGDVLHEIHLKTHTKRIGSKYGRSTGMCGDPVLIAGT